MFIARFPSDIEVDYAGPAVTPDTLLRLLTGRLPSSTPGSQRLDSDPGSNVLLWVTCDRLLPTPHCSTTPLTTRPV